MRIVVLERDAPVQACASFAMPPAGGSVNESSLAQLTWPVVPLQRSPLAYEQLLQECRP